MGEALSAFTLQDCRGGAEGEKKWSARELEARSPLAKPEPLGQSLPLPPAQTLLPSNYSLPNTDSSAMAGRIRNPSSRALAIAAEASTPAAPPRVRNRKPSASRQKKVAATKNGKDKSKAVDPDLLDEEEETMEDEEEKEPDLTLCRFSSSGRPRGWDEELTARFRLQTVSASASTRENNL